MQPRPIADANGPRPPRSVATLALLLLTTACRGLAADPPIRDAAPRPKKHSIAPQIEAVTFHSRVLGRDKTFCVVLPQGYSRTRKDWPVLFLFHGRGRHERSLVDDPLAKAALLKSRCVVVLPDGDDGWYVNSPIRKQDRYEDYIEELTQVAAEQYKLSSRRERRGLCGWSMGGYGCVRFAQTHANQFSAVAPVIGLLDFPRAGLPAGQSYDVPTDRFGMDEAVWREHNPLTHASRLKGMSILITTADAAFDRTMNENFARRLKELKIDHEYQTLRGGHTFEVVRASLPGVVAFMNRSLARRLEE